MLVDIPCCVFFVIPDVCSVGLTTLGGWHPDFVRLVRRCAHAAYAGAPGLPEAWAAVFGRVAEALSCFVVCATSPQFLRFALFPVRGAASAARTESGGLLADHNTLVSDAYYD